MAIDHNTLFKLLHKMSDPAFWRELAKREGESVQDIVLYQQQRIYDCVRQALEEHNTFKDNIAEKDETHRVWMAACCYQF